MHGFVHEGKSWMATSGETGGVQLRHTLGGQKREMQFGDGCIVSFDSTMIGQQRVFACGEVGPNGRIVTYTFP